MPRPAPPIEAAEWLNAPEPVRLTDLAGKVVCIVFLQRLCPGCSHYALPQARRVAETFTSGEVVVLGVHSVFEHHEQQSDRAGLARWLADNGCRFPVAVDAPSETTTAPRTMTAYNLQGTPSLVLVDRQGRMRTRRFGPVSDMQVGAEIMALLLERQPASGES
ncbi:MULTISPECIES: peroxiredoxin family protein [Brevundimonas]|jgi:peroxiredoxin|uniref:peroxiredoxin family protein n=1 Tax=Brevundimonas TaxID=41275 RepID=UPI0019036FFC|nr:MULTISPECIES: redoxin domain-containing protein [Brevundimonas]MBK1970304.1 redoxin family protein [Brevundimonas diminuta]MBK1975853.1 redoxin family protein [Brevundimonas diminuta]MDA0744486.1 redoxin family protein [Pseudomonadota bacterium]MDM8353856.1 redoxin family protein [Brevundimonas diminuta]